MISVGIIGGSGYTGKKLIQFCNNHPFVDGFEVYGNITAGENISTVFPEMSGWVDDKTIKSVGDLSLEHDLYFTALPHGEALNYIPFLINQGKKVIDLGGDYRLDMEEIYTNWYKIKHSSPYLLKNKIYGLADFSDTDYSGYDLVANPGCYPTAALLSLLPLASNFSEEILSVSTVAYSGTSGAGKSAKTDLLMSEMDGNVRAYNVNQHRHQPEILQELHKAGFNSPFSFTTHLLPVAVGIYSTTSIHLKSKISENDLNQAFKESYGSSFFVRLRNTPPNLGWVTGTNFCDINVAVKDKTVILTSAIDNLIKGAAGQAIQNMNKLFDWDEKLGILNKGVKDVSVY
ncbi:MAG: N-acetyl-gamma-glutamyl-phosphate reductase [Ignavibacteriales bacterium]|nr:N-acetyl-gamma-glutamyl-phosphate reductase [Ignavibacteriales bacterium]